MSASIASQGQAFAHAPQPMHLSLISATPQGLSCYYDTILDVGHFVIVDDPAITSGFVWQERLWGNMRLKPLEML